MLTRLYIKNYALIEHLELLPLAGFNVFTGETGAGKSIILGALGMLTGAKFDGKILLDEEAKCIIEGSFKVKSTEIDSILESFDLDKDDELVVRREFAPGGKSRVFINDSPAGLDALKALGPLLLDIHSQHDTIQLANTKFQKEVVDNFGKLHDLRREVGLAFKAYKAASENLNELLAKKQSENQNRRALLEEWERIDAYKPLLGEQKALEEELARLEHSGLIGEKLTEAHNFLEDGDLPALDALRQSRVALEKIASYLPEVKEWVDRIESARLDLKDLSESLNYQLQKVEADPNRQAFVASRLDALYSLLKRLHIEDEEGLISRYKALKAELELFNDIDSLIKKAETDKENCWKDLNILCNELSLKRKTTAESLENRISSLLVAVGIPNGVLKIEMKPVEPGPTGADNIEFFFTANKGVAPKELKNVASGGEFSRLMLCLKALAADENNQATLIFDEIDTGVSGKVAVQVADLIKEMASERQVWVITHLPQMAAKAESHFYVYKDHSNAKTVSRIKRLNDKEAINTIAGMISGDAVTDAALQSARELMGERS